VYDDCVTDCLSFEIVKIGFSSTMYPIKPHSRLLRKRNGIDDSN
jgi:hypothetical protein